MNGKLVSAFLGILVGTSVSIASAQDISGAPLPNVIPQDTHDRLVEQANRGECIEGGDNPYWHWIACGHTVDVTNAEIIRARQGIQQAYISSCDIIRNFPGNDGSVWKPVSESTGNVVFILPERYFTLAKQIRVIDLSLGFFAGQTIVNAASKRPELQNGNRTHFDLPVKASSLPKATLLYIFRTDNLKECLIVNDPVKRVG